MDSEKKAWKGELWMKWVRTTQSTAMHRSPSMKRRRSLGAGEDVMASVGFIFGRGWDNGVRPLLKTAETAGARSRAQSAGFAEAEDGEAGAADG